jgi:hypothetical protein
MLMYLSELGQVEGGDLFRLLDLLLVGADLGLQLIDQGLGDKSTNQKPGLHFSPMASSHVKTTLILYIFLFVIAIAVSLGE